jgi:hypothetical protein
MPYRPLSTCDPSLQIYGWGSTSYGKLPIPAYNQVENDRTGSSGRTVPGVIPEPDDRENPVLYPMRVDLASVLNHQPIKQIACSFESTFILTGLYIYDLRVTLCRSTRSVLLWKAWFIYTNKIGTC